MVFYLDVWTKYLIVLCCVGLIAITGFIVICLLSPFCSSLFSNMSNVREEKGKDKKRRAGLFSRGDSIELTNLNPNVHQQYGSPLSSYYPPLILNYPDAAPLSENDLLSNTTADSCYSSLSPTTGHGSRSISPVSVSVDEIDILSTQCSPITAESEQIAIYGHLFVVLTYSCVDESNECHNLPGREYLISSCDSFVRICVLKSRTRFQRSRSHSVIIYEFQSSTIKKTRFPYFNENFSVELTKQEIKDYVIKFVVFDRDRYVNPSRIAETTIPLMELNRKNITGIPLSLDLHESNQNNGEILIGLTYLPTSERLTINLIRAMNLRFENVTINIDSLNTEVRVLLLVNGRLIQKKKTQAIPGNNSPDYNCRLMFDVPVKDLNQIIFIVAVANRGEVVTESDDSTQEKPPRDSTYIGKVFLGSAIQSQSKNHWRAMLDSPRQELSSWHVLK